MTFDQIQAYVNRLNRLCKGRTITAEEMNADYKSLVELTQEILVQVGKDNGWVVTITP